MQCRSRRTNPSLLFPISNSPQDHRNTTRTQPASQIDDELAPRGRCRSWCGGRCGRDENRRHKFWRSRDQDHSNQWTTVLYQRLSPVSSCLLPPRRPLSPTRGAAPEPEPEPVRAMQTTPATSCGAHGAAFTPCPRCSTPHGSLRKPFTAGSSRRTPGHHRLLAPMASTVDSPGSSSSSDFAKRIERAWLIFQVLPHPLIAMLSVML